MTTKSKDDLVERLTTALGHDERALSMPDWPARMGEDMAALYLGVSVSTLRARSEAGAYPKPVRDGKRVLYARCQLDRFVRAQFGLPMSENEQEGRGWAA